MFPLCPSSSTSIFTPIQSLPFSNYPHHGKKTLKTSKKSHFLPKKTYPFCLFLNFSSNSKWVCFYKSQFSLNLDCFNDFELKNGNYGEKMMKNGRFSRLVWFVLFFIVIGMCPVSGRVPVATALPSISELVWRKKGKIVKEEKKVVSWKENKYSRYTDRLLECVSGVSEVIEAVRIGKGGVKDVEVALKKVKLKREELQGEIMSELYGEMRELRKSKWELSNKANEVLDVVLLAKGEQDKLLIKLRGGGGGGGGDEGVRERIGRLVETMDSGEREYNALQEKVGEIESEMSRRETMALSIGVRELSFIERECERLVKSFTHEIRRSRSVSKTSAASLPRKDIQKELEAAQREHVKQTILPSVVDFDDAVGPLFEGEETSFALRINQALKASKNMQRDLESRIRRDMKKFGKEKRVLVNTPEGDVVKGFPEVQLKWMFGDKEVVVPKAVSVFLHHGWKRWRDDAKTKLKKSILENADQGEQYVAERLERIVLDRDRVVSQTLYNEDKNRWEMDPVAVPYAISKNLVQYARIRHDWGAMYIGLKGEDKEFYVNIKEYEVLFENFGGFDGLYLKMLASGVPTAVQLMWIPLSELGIYQQILLLTRISVQSFNGIWNTRIISLGREWIFEKVKNINDDVMMMIVFPLVELLIPYPVRISLGMAWPEELGITIGSNWYLKWQSEAETNFKLRKTDELGWYFWFLIRGFVYGYVLFHLFKFLRREVPGLLGYGPYRQDPNIRKFKRMIYYFRFKKEKILEKQKAGFDPIKTAFDSMKRVKNPPIRLKDFGSVESMREEINEVVAFLQNPKAFQKLGARAPRGVLIVGERGTGKTSLALAIAAEARVPVVNIEAQQLEAGLWVGQSASNVRELFQTARDLAPVIIFVEDFDLFAGARGKFVNTKNQDHEAFINQLLVELDGFEKQDGVVLMATTRNLQQIDEALRRPGRMDRIFNLQLPTQTERESILQKAARDTMDPDLIDFVDWRKVAEKTAYLRPIELKLVPVSLEGGAFRTKFLDKDELMGYVSWFATVSTYIPSWLRKSKIGKHLSKMLVNHLGLTLTKEDLNNVVDLMEPYGQISDGIELYTPPVDWTRETKFPHAVWAAGRGLIALLLPNFDVVDTMWLEPLAWEGIGCTKITQAKHGGTAYGNVQTVSYLEKKLVFCFGSHVASQLLLPFGEENLLSDSELKQAQEIATRMVLQYGWGPDDNPTVYHHGIADTALSMGNEHEYEMASKVEKIFNLAYDKANDMLKKNRKVLEVIVDEMLEHELLMEKDLERIMESNGGIREKEPFSLSRAYESESISIRYLENGTASGAPLLGGAT